MDLKTWAMKLGSVAAGVCCFVIAATVLNGSGYELAVAGAGGLLIGLPINLGAKP